MNAVKKFDYRRRVKFSTYATRLIIQALYKTLQEDTRTIRITEHGIQILTEIDKIAGDLLQQGLKPTASKIAEFLPWNSNEIGILMKVSKRVASLETPLENNDTQTLADTLVNSNSQDMAETADRMFLRMRMAEVLDTLTLQERIVIRLRYGLDGNGIRYLDEVASVFGFTRQRANQIEAEALKKLRHPSHAAKLRDYYDD